MIVEVVCVEGWKGDGCVLLSKVRALLDCLACATNLNILPRHAVTPYSHLHLYHLSSCFHIYEEIALVYVDKKTLTHGVQCPNGRTQIRRLRLTGCKFLTGARKFYLFVCVDKKTLTHGVQCLNGRTQIRRLRPTGCKFLTGARKFYLFVYVDKKTLTHGVECPNGRT
jgi:biotin operon repressor